jgi:hypothetical protein
MKENRRVHALRFLPFEVLFLALFGVVVLAPCDWLMSGLFGWKVSDCRQAPGRVALD